ncbi:MAG TPA: phosphoribosyltransferase family protein [Candidatus Paceibacterota bacterium]|nr:phosphoribosyltransferase family protein [Candidatus Paceibacterota bacterium]
MIFKDRKEAGEKLAEKLRALKDEDMVIYALPRGGVVLGKVIAKALGQPLDLLVVRKVGHPTDPEYAVGAVAEDGHTRFSEEGEGLQKELKESIEKERKEAERRRKVYTEDKTISALGKTAVIVDDGIATGLTMELAISEILHQKPKKVIVAIPVVPSDTAEKLKKEIDELVAIDIDKNYLGAVGAYYEFFPQLTDEEVINLLKY